MTESLERAVEIVAHWRLDPVRYVREVFGVEPDDWQERALRFAALPGGKRLSLQACVGPGKSAVLAWIGWWFLTCMGEAGEHPCGAAVSISGENLRDNLWKEMAKWRGRSEYLKAKFTWEAQRVFSNDHPETWWISARRWSRAAEPETQGATLSGLHSQYVLALLDESGEIPPAIMKAAEQALSNCTWGLIAQAGNPTSLDGCLYRAAVPERADWHVIEVNGDPDDPLRAKRVDIKWARRNIERYGRDDPWVISHILGRFPPVSFNHLLTREEIEAAMSRNYRPEEFESAAKVLGVDCGRGGLDPSVIVPRQGLIIFPWKKLRGMEGPDVAGHVAHTWKRWDADACFIDDTGGYGASTIDHLKRYKYKPVGVVFSERATDRGFYNKRAEILWAVRDWVKGGGSLPRMQPEEILQFTEPKFTFRRDQVLFEDKDQIKARLGMSTDILDACGLTFSHPVMPRRRTLESWEPSGRKARGKSRLDWSDR